MDDRRAECNISVWNKRGIVWFATLSLLHNVLRISSFNRESWGRSRFAFWRQDTKDRMWKLDKTSFTTFDFFLFDYSECLLQLLDLRVIHYFIVTSSYPLSLIFTVYCYEAFFTLPIQNGGGVLERDLLGRKRCCSPIWWTTIVRVLDMPIQCCYWTGIRKLGVNIHAHSDMRKICHGFFIAEFGI